MALKISLLAVAAVAASVSADGKQPSPAKIREARSVMHEYARCVVGRHGRKAEEAILANVNNRDIKDDYRELVDGLCLQQVASYGQMSFKGDLYRYALAEALVDRDYAKEGPSSLADRAPLTHLPAPDPAALQTKLAAAKTGANRKAAQESYDQAAAASWLSRFGECVVRQDPEGARKWLATKTSSPDEDAAIDVLRPAFAGCLDDGSMKFNRTIMRGTVALNYFRLAKSAPMSAAAGSAN